MASSREKRIRGEGIKRKGNTAYLNVIWLAVRKHAHMKPIAKRLVGIWGKSLGNGKCSSMGLRTVSMGIGRLIYETIDNEKRMVNRIRNQKWGIFRTGVLHNYAPQPVSPRGIGGYLGIELSLLLPSLPIQF